MEAKNKKEKDEQIAWQHGLLVQIPELPFTELCNFADKLH
jgi:hypothetical protein